MLWLNNKTAYEAAVVEGLVAVDDGLALVVAGVVAAVVVGTELGDELALEAELLAELAALDDPAGAVEDPDPLEAPMQLEAVR